MKQTYTVPSCDGIHTLSGVVYLPEVEPIGFFHIVHGMTEHIARYDRLMSEVSALGYICFGYDHLGHGNTAKDESELGYIAPKDGYELLCRDVKTFSDAVMKEYGETCGKSLPYYLMGHSMGSFVTRLAVEKYVKPDRYIIMGTGGSNPAAGAGLAVVALLKRFYGDRHISPLLYKLAFGSYNDRFGGGTAEDPSPWLTRDAAARKAYYADPFCTFQFTTSAMGDLIRLMKEANRKDWFRNLPNELPILLVSGAEDPVGNYGKGVEEVYQNLLKAGKTAKLFLYPGARHEILNDSTYEEVKRDILAFLRK